MNLFKYLFLVSLLCILQACDKPIEKCTVSGILIDSDAQSIGLMQAHQDPRSHKTVYPVVDGKFSFELDASKQIAYSLYLDDDSHFPIIFFPDLAEIKLKIYPFQESHKNQIEGGEINQQYQQFKAFEKEQFESLNENNRTVLDSIQLLRKTRNYYTKHMSDLYKLLGSAKSGEENNAIYSKMDSLRQIDQELTIPAKYLKSKITLAQQELNYEKHNYLENKLSIASYFSLVMDLQSFNDELFDLNRIKQTNEKLSSQFPNHPYSSLATSLIQGMTILEIGNDFVDFTLPDLNGTKYSLSELSEGKYTLVDLWAPWCGSCLAKSRVLIPVYEEYSELGFEVVGVAGQFKDIERIKSRLSKDQHPWLTLIEHPTENSIWNDYGVRWRGGLTFLLDSNGKVALVDPSAEEVREFLRDKL